VKILLVQQAPEATMSGAFIQRDLREVDAVIISRPGYDAVSIINELTNWVVGEPNETEEVPCE